MPVDNQLYDRPGDIWWDEAQPLSALRTALNPVRLEYLSDVLRRAGLGLAGSTVLDIGCGGGLLAEEFACRGALVIGVDPSAASLQTARAHARAQGLEIEYRQGRGEKLPLGAATVDLACCVDVLEHVDNLEQVIGETARVLRPGGVFLFDTINRTHRSRLVMIKLLQEWRLTAWLPANLHSWERFITPAELIVTMDRHRLRDQDLVGLTPGVGLPRLIQLLWQLRRERITPGELGRRARLVLTGDMRVAYAGSAVKADSDQGSEKASGGEQ